MGEGDAWKSDLVGHAVHQGAGSRRSRFPALLLLLRLLGVGRRRWAWTATLVATLCTLLYEASCFWRHLRLVRELDDSPSHRMSATFDADRHRRWIRGLLRTERLAVATVRGWFKGARLRCIPRPAVRLC